MVSRTLAWSPSFNQPIRSSSAARASGVRILDRSAASWSRSSRSFYVKDGQDICYIKIDKDFIAFGFGEVANPSVEEGAYMHPVAWTLTSLDTATEAKIGALVTKAAG